MSIHAVQATMCPRAWGNTLSWPGRAVVCRKDGSYILYNYSGGFSWYLYGPDNRLQYDIAGTLGNGAWGYIVGTYGKNASTNKQRLYLNGTRVAQVSDTLPLDLNSNPLGIGRHVSGIAGPLQRPYRRVPHRVWPALRRLDRDHLEQHYQSRCVRRGRGRGAGRRRAATACCAGGSSASWDEAKDWCRPAGPESPVHQLRRPFDETTVNSDANCVASRAASDLDFYEMGERLFTGESIMRRR